MMLVGSARLVVAREDLDKVRYVLTPVWIVLLCFLVIEVVFVLFLYKGSLHQFPSIPSCMGLVCLSVLFTCQAKNMLLVSRVQLQHRLADCSVRFMRFR